MLSPRESRLSLRRRCALLDPAAATTAAAAAEATEAGVAVLAADLDPGGPGGLLLSFQQSLDRGHSPSSSGLVSR